MDELRDIKPIVDYAPGWPWWAWTLVAAGGVVVCLVAWLLLRRRRPPQKPPVDANHAALVALTALAGVAPADRYSGQRLQTQLSMILRRWVEMRWELRATDMTTEEIAAERELSALMGGEAYASLLRSLELADRVRFANEDIAADAHIAAVEQARDLVSRA
jgi:hypothetical protein